MISKLEYREIEGIYAHRERRQRKELNADKVKDIASSVAELSLFHPILVTADGGLVAGEHRLTAFQYNLDNAVPCPWDEYLGWNRIPVRIVTTTNPTTLEAIELEENVKRSSMDWQDVATAISRYHSLQLSKNKDWTQTATAAKLSMVKSWVNVNIVVAGALAKGEKKILNAAGVTAAYQIVGRETDRAIEAELENITGDLGLEPLAQPPEGFDSMELPPPVPKGDVILNTDFLSWIKDYEGPKFNFIHCDFPYGINHHKSDQGHAEGWGGYEDSPETFWTLVNTMFQNLDTFMHPTGHIVFWYAMKYHTDLVNQILKWAPELTIDPYPLIWSKSDGKGIVPDHQRGPRRTYETALHICRGDRKILTPVTNSYAAPTGAKRHQSEKPEAMLRHFFSMYVDGYSSVLDPTAGGGSALRAAASLGAGTVLGLEVNEEYAAEANSAFLSAARLRSGSGA